MSGLAALPTIPGSLGDVRVGIDGWLTWDDATELAAGERARAQLAGATPGIPKLRADGMLPAGVHQAELGEVFTRFGHSPRRLLLMEQLAEALPRLQQAGVTDVLVGGSLLSSKVAPSDVDLAWFSADDVATDMRIDRIRSTLPDGVGTFRGAAIVGNAPSLEGATPGETFAEFFQHDRAGARRGVIRIPSASFDDGIAALGRGSAMLDGGSGLNDALRAVRALVPRA